ncbi:MAG: hypothetical protein QOK16_2084 [Solirubrobacteraceae bacterium]|jgi:hypothetical protein|nr:hypothetical protein [Solirubrobacteraceae bacterium]
MPHHQSRSRTVAQRTCDATGSEAAAAHRRGIAASAVLTDECDVGLLRHMSAHQRQAVAEFGSQMQTSETSIRQRVSGDLSALRAYRAAQELVRQDRAYRYGGGHGAVLSWIGPREPLDCSSSASLILVRAGLFEPAQAWTSRRFADEWGEPDEGRYLTVWANGDAVFGLGTVFVEPRPRVKTKCPVLRGGGELHIVGRHDITSLPDPDGAIHRLLELADGTRSATELYSELRASYPRLAEHDIAEAVFQLVSVGLFALDRWNV